MDVIRVAATARSPNYLPQYLAESLGYFREEGLEVATVVSDPWEGVLKEIAEGRADAVLGGAWLPSIYYDRVCRYKIFAQLNGRYPLALVSREPVPSDDWDWLVGRTVVVPSSGGVAAYMFFTGLLRERGIDPSRLTFVRDLSHEMLASLFAGGLGDAMVTYMVNAQHLIDGGRGHLAASLDAVSGPMPNSVYYTTEEIVETRAVALARFARALQRAMNWVAENGVAKVEVHDVLAAQWPDEDQARLLRVVAGFRASGLWVDGVRVDKSALARWQRFLVEGSLLEAAVAYDDLVDERAIEFALGQISQ